MKKGQSIIHGECINNIHSRLYNVWATMYNRVTNPNYHHFKDYGGRGLTICEEWLIPANFITWAKANGYTDNLQIDRIDNDKGYYPDNCRFVSPSQNSVNRRKRPDFGIYLQKDGRFRVIIRRHGHNYHAGYFNSIDVARIERNKLFKRINERDETWVS